MNLRMPAQFGTALLLAAAALGATDRGKKPVRASWNDYTGLIRNNMFLKNRASAIISDTPPGVVAQVTTPAQSTVLIGVVRQDGEYIAFLEDFRTNTTTKARVGDAVCGGRLAGITMEAVEFEHDGVKTRVEVGKNLEGTDKSSVAAAAAAATPSAPGEAGAPAATPAAAPAAPPLPPEIILERLKQKRLKELGK